MTIEQAKNEIAIISSSSMYSNEEKEVRINMYRSYIEKCIKDNEYNRRMDEFGYLAAALEKESNNEFFYNEDVGLNEAIIRNYIVKSDVGQYIESNNDSYTFSDLKYYWMDRYEMETGNNAKNIRDASKLYELNKALLDTSRKQAFIIRRGLSKILDDNLLCNYIEKYNPSANVMFHELKSEEELENNKAIILKTIDMLYSEKNLLDIKTKTIAQGMVMQLIDYSVNGPKKIDKSKNQLEQDNTSSRTK